MIFYIPSNSVMNWNNIFSRLWSHQIQEFAHDVMYNERVFCIIRSCKKDIQKILLCHAFGTAMMAKLYVHII